MKKLLILSGKGGTGKTTVAASFIIFSRARAYADCDVDAPNLHLVAAPDTEPERSEYFGSSLASIDSETCIGCGKCVAACRFDAIVPQGHVYAVNEFACEGCRVCQVVCPNNAVHMVDDVAGYCALYRGEPTFSTASLKMGRGNSGKLVSKVKEALFSAEPAGDIAVIDGAPGIGCPVIASVNGVDLTLVVTEPSVSGISDLKRLLKTVSTFKTKAAVCVNKADICPEKTQEIKDLCAHMDVPFVGVVPYDPAVLQAVNSGKSIACVDCPARDALHAIYDETMKLLG